jgi:4-hydroxy-4-methyl-2-oxoglutarate aldolase
LRFVEKLGFPVFCGYYTPLDIVGSGPQLLSQHPIRIGDVRIDSGEYVLADRDGIMTIPQALVEEVTVEAEGVLRKENVVRKAILQGVDPVAAYLKYGKF